MLKNKGKFFTTLVGAAVLSSSLYAANYGVGLKNNQWNLIGVTGYHQDANTVSTSGAVTATSQCTTVACMDVGGVLNGSVISDMVLIDIVDSANTITWDANSSKNANDKNGYAADTGASAAGNKLFTVSGLPASTTVVTFENNGTTFGSSDHSIVGLQALNHSDSTLAKAAISFINDSDINEKSYTTPMRTMYLRSLYSPSTGMPDVKIIYQGSMEGQTFKIQFSESATVNTSDSRTGNPFVWTTTTQTNIIYQGTFGKDYTWDSPMSTANGLTATADPGAAASTTSTTTYTDYRSISQIFDQNLTDNNGSGYFNPTTSTVRQMLEGNLTVYEYKYNADGTVGWDSSWFYRTNQSAISSDSENEIANDQITAGKGYWVKFDAWNGATTTVSYDGDSAVSVPGLLVSNKIASATGTAQESVSYTSDIVKPGWNLISFDDGDLRHSTTGIAIPGSLGATTVNLLGPNGEYYSSAMGGAGGATLALTTAACNYFNRAIDGNNTVASSYGNSQNNTNDFNIRCYPADLGGTFYTLLISDRAFSVDIPKAAGAATINNVRTLAGVNYSSKSGSNTGHDANITITAGKPVITNEDGTPTHYRYNSRYGEYALGVTMTPTLANAAMVAQSIGKFSLTLPTFETSAGGVSTSTFTYAATTAHAQTAATEVNTTVLALLGNAAAVNYSSDIYLAADSQCTAAGKCGVAWNIHNLGVTGNVDGNQSVLVAMNKRFYVRDNTFVRAFDVTSSALGYGFGAKVEGGGGWEIDDLNSPATQSETTITCGALNGTVFDMSSNAGGTGTAIAYCINGSTETNNSVMFLSGNMVNFNVLEANVSNTSGTPATTDALINTATYYSNIDVFTEKTASSSYGTEANQTVKGAIQSVYKGTALATASISATTSVISATAATTDATYTPIWAEDFPNNGPLYTLTTISDGASAYLKPEVFLTAKTNSQVNSSGAVVVDSGAVISWKAIDVTRDPKEWFDDANHFDLFSTESGKGYWVYASEGYTSPVTATLSTTPYTITAYHHFNNTKDQNYNSVTTNSTDGELTVTVGGLYRQGATTNYTSGASFNVDATVGGSTTSMLTDTVLAAGATANFVMPLNSFETAGFNTPTTTAKEVSITAVDGLGGKATVTTTIPFIKPGTPTLAATGSQIAITSTGSEYVYVFENNISDTTYASQIKFEQQAAAGVTTFDTATGDFVTSFAVPSPVTAPTSIDGSTSVASPVVDLRFVPATAAKANIGTTVPVFLGDQYHYSFAPITAQTHVLEVTTNGATDKDPRRYDQADTTPTGTDSGVELESNVDGGKIGLSYPPHVSSKLDEGFAHTIHVGTSTQYFGLITYTPAYEGEYFFLYVETAAGIGSMYWGVFPNTGADGAGSGVSTNGSPNNIYVLNQITGSTQKIAK